MHTRTPQDRQPGGVVFCVIPKSCTLFESNGLTSAAACRLAFCDLNVCISRGHHREGCDACCHVVKLLLGRSLESRSCSSRTPQSGPPRSNVHCWRPAIQEVEVCGGEHSSACLLSEGPNMQAFGRCCGVRKLSPSSRFTHDSMKTFSMMSSTDTAVYVVRIANANLSNTRRKMAWFVLIFE